VKVEYEAWKTKNIPASPISPANPGKIISNISRYLGLLALLPHQPQNEFPGKVKAGVKKFLDARGRKYPEGKKSISIIRDQNAIDRMCHTLMDEHRELQNKTKNLSSKNTEYQSQVSQLETSLRMKDDEIAELQRQAEDLSLNKRDCLTQFEEYKSEILELKSKCENLLSENQNLSRPTNSYSSYFRSAINTGLMMYALYTIWTERSTEMSESARQELRGKLF
jgi:chromosome segregation ATPase